MDKRTRFLSTLLALTLISTITAAADELFQLSWRGTVYREENGRLVGSRFSEQNFVQQVAQANGLNPRELIFVYRADKRDTAVVRASNGEFIANVSQMEYVFTDVGNPDQTVVRQAFLFDEQHDAAIGSVFGIERQKRDSSGRLASYSFRGNFNYSYPERGEVYSGSFRTMKRVQERF